MRGIIRIVILHIFIFTSICNSYPQGNYTKITLQNGLPRLTINDKQMPFTGLFVYNVSTVGGKRFEHFVPYESPEWLGFMKGFVDQVNQAGMTYLGFGVQLERDFSKLDDLFDYALTKNVYLFPSINTSHPPIEWLRENQDSLQKTNTGEITNTVSFNNKEYWKIIDPKIKNFIEHYKNHPALLGWDIRIGVTGENNYAPTYLKDIMAKETSWADYSEFTLKRFRVWLGERYKTNSALQTAWQDTLVTFQTAQIPQPSSPDKGDFMMLIESANGPGDKRRDFYDWQLFRLEEKTIERNHFLKLVKELDPNHIVAFDPAFRPFDGASRAQNGSIDGWEAYISPYVDVIITHPRIAHTDEPGRFNISRSEFYKAITFATRNNKLITWVNEDTGDLVASLGKEGRMPTTDTEAFSKITQNVESIWRIDSIIGLTSVLGSGCGWVTGVQDYRIPVWSETERDEFKRLNHLYSIPDLKRQSPEILIIADDFNDSFEYTLGGPIARFSKWFDRKIFIDNLYKIGLPFDIVSTEEIKRKPQILEPYKAIFLLDLVRLDKDIASILSDYRNMGKGLFIGGRTGIFDRYGNMDYTSLEILLGSNITDEIKFSKEWSFSTEHNLTNGLLGRGGNKNIFYIPISNLDKAGYKGLAQLSGKRGQATPMHRGSLSPFPVIGIKDKTIYWFPQLSSLDTESLSLFQKNLWRFFGAEVQEADIEIFGNNYKYIFSPIGGNYKIFLNLKELEKENPEGITLFDWISMKPIKNITPFAPLETHKPPTGFASTINLDLQLEKERTYLIGIIPITKKPIIKTLSITEATEPSENKRKILCI